MRKYSAFTMLEMIIVMVIMFVLSTISVIVYRSMVDSFTINEVSLTIAQDIRATQRAAMLLDRGSNERWLYGIGIDFRDIESKKIEGEEREVIEYHIFKWCSSFNYYDKGEPKLTNEVPNLDDMAEIESASLHLSSLPVSSCERGDAIDAHLVVDTKQFHKYNNLEFILKDSVSNKKVAFILFESVSGKAFLYDESGFLLNYTKASNNEVEMVETASQRELFRLEILPKRVTTLSPRTLVVPPVSGTVYFEIEEI